MYNGKYFSEVQKYCQDCKSGIIKANIYRIKAIDRFYRDLEDERYEFNPKDADFIISIIQKTICHMQGETQDGEPLRGTPFILMPFHKFIIYNLFGIYRKGTKIKKYHEALIFIPRKNVKTSFSAALAYAVGLLYRKSGSKISTTITNIL